MVTVILAKNAAAHKLHHIVQHRLPTMNNTAERAKFFAHRYNHKHKSFGSIWEGAVVPMLAEFEPGCSEGPAGSLKRI